MLLKRNRYGLANLPGQLLNQAPQEDGNDWCFKFECYKHDSTLDDFEAYLSKTISDHEQNRIVLLSFLENIDRLDNLVQDSCENDHLQGGLDISNYKLHIGYLDVKENIVTVTYYGTIVNTEWKAEFKIDGLGTWTKVNF